MKRILGILVVIMMISVILNIVPVFAFGDGFDSTDIPQSPGSAQQVSKLKAPIARLANTIFLVLQIASIAGVIILGIKFMYMNADKKAEVKNGLVMAVIGMILVFGASTVAQFVVGIFDEATKVN